MPVKIFAGVVAVTLVLSYLVPLASKLKEASLIAVFLIGVAMMLVDLWQSLRSGEDH